MVAEAKKRRLRNAGHVQKMEEERVHRNILDQYPERRRPGRPIKR